MNPRAEIEMCVSWWASVGTVETRVDGLVISPSAAEADDVVVVARAVHDALRVEQKQIDAVLHITRVAH